MWKKVIRIGTGLGVWVAFALLMVSLNVGMIVSSKLYDAIWGGVQKAVGVVIDMPWSDRRSHSELDLDLKHAQKSLEAERAASDKKSTKIASIHSDLEMQKAQLRNLTGELTKSKADIDLREQELRNLQQSYSKLSSDYDLSLEKSKQLGRQLAAPKKNGLSADARRSAEAIIERMHIRTIRSVKRTTSAEVAELIPVLGTGVGLGLIGYDLYEACRTLDDVTELERLIDPSTANLPREENELCGMEKSALIARLTGADPQKAICIEARIRTKQISPPECSDFPLRASDYEEGDLNLGKHLLAPDYDD